MRRLFGVRFLFSFAGRLLISFDYIFIWMYRFVFECMDIWTILFSLLSSVNSCLQNIIGFVTVYIAIERRPHEIRTNQNEYLKWTLYSRFWVHVGHVVYSCTVDFPWIFNENVGGSETWSQSNSISIRWVCVCVASACWENVWILSAIENERDTKRRRKREREREIKLYFRITSKNRILYMLHTCDSHHHNPNWIFYMYILHLI